VGCDAAVRDKFADILSPSSGRRVSQGNNREQEVARVA
jgi:hypothetical protein